MKKKIFIGVHYLELGGAEISLIGLLQALDYSKVDVDLFVYSHQGPLMRFIPQEVNLLPEIDSYSYFEKPLKSVLMSGFIRLFFARLVAKVLNWFYVHKHNLIDKEYSGSGYVGKFASKVLPDLYNYGEYDLAISFLTPHNFVLDHVCAKNKICWIHTDYSKVAINSEVELPVWESFDHIISISSDVTRSFVRIFPSLADKIVEIENILSSEFVRSRAMEFSPNCIDSDKSITNILSVGRFSYAKNYDNIPDICKKSIERGLKIRWYLIGYGPDEEMIKNKIVEAGMQDYVILLGKRENPYPYINSCDIYVQPSRYEGKSVTVREAQMLCKPVVVTNYPTAGSQVKNGVDGVIVPMDNEGCAKGIAELILNNQLQMSIIDYLRKHDYSNALEINKIYDLL